MRISQSEKDEYLKDYLFIPTVVDPYALSLIVKYTVQELWKSCTSLISVHDTVKRLPEMLDKHEMFEKHKCPPGAKFRKSCIYAMKFSN